jgi:hypothetical protein
VAFNIARNKCDAVYAAKTTAERENVLRGAGAVDVEVEAVLYALMAGLVDFNDRANMHMGGGKTVEEVMATMMRTKGSGGPGPSGRP